MENYMKLNIVVFLLLSAVIFKATMTNLELVSLAFFYLVFLFVNTFVWKH